jgi:hypothetical protein
MAPPKEEKFPLEEVERLKQLARVEEQFPEADACDGCNQARAASGDPTDLCAEHLRRIYGV